MNPLTPEIPPELLKHLNQAPDPDRTWNWQESEYLSLEVRKELEGPKGPRQIEFTHILLMQVIQELREIKEWMQAFDKRGEE